MDMSALISSRAALSARGLVKGTARPPALPGRDYEVKFPFSFPSLLLAASGGGRSVPGAGSREPRGWARRGDRPRPARAAGGPSSPQLSTQGGGRAWCLRLAFPSHAPGAAKVWDGWRSRSVGTPHGPPPYFLPGPLTLGSTVLSLQSPRPAFCPSAPGGSVPRDTSRRSFLGSRFLSCRPGIAWTWIPHHPAHFSGNARTPPFFLGNNETTRVFRSAQRLSKRLRVGGDSGGSRWSRPSTSPKFPYASAVFLGPREFRWRYSVGQVRCLLLFRRRAVQLGTSAISEPELDFS